MRKLAIISTHPIQYNAPLFAMLTRRGNIAAKVFYTWGEAVLKDKYDPGFGKSIKWDIPLLEGYDFTFVNNISVDAGSHHFKGIDNPSLLKEITGWGADAVLVYGWSFKSHLKAMRYFKGKIPVLFRGDSTLLDGTGSLTGLIKEIFLRWVYHFVDKVLYVGTNNMAYYLKFGLKRDELVWAPHAVDNNRFRYSLENMSWVEACKKRLAIPSDAIIFLFAGKIEEKKDPALLLEAFCELSCANCYLIMLGNGVLEHDLKSKFASRKAVHFMDFQNQSVMPAVYQLADVFVLPSKGPGETWGLAINEAMAAGKAVLASDKCGAAADLIKNGENGYIFNHSNKADLIIKMEKLVASRKRLKDMGNHSVELITEWNYEKVCLVIEKVVNAGFRE